MRKETHACVRSGLMYDFSEPVVSRWTRSPSALYPYSSAAVIKAVMASEWRPAVLNGVAMDAASSGVSSSVRGMPRTR